MVKMMLDQKKLAGPVCERASPALSPALVSSEMAIGREIIRLFSMDQAAATNVPSSVRRTLAELRRLCEAAAGRSTNVWKMCHLPLKSLGSIEIYVLEDCPFEC
jgi:hypothetical protein